MCTNTPVKKEPQPQMEFFYSGLGLPWWLRWSRIRRLPMQETQVQSLHQEAPLEEGMATRSSILAWRMPQTAEPGETGLQFQPVSET